MMVLTSVGAPGTAANQQQCSNMSFLGIKQKYSAKLDFDMLGQNKTWEVGRGGEEDTPNRNKGYISGISQDLEFPSH